MKPRTDQPIIRCIFCHTVTNSSMGRAYCNDCNINYFIMTRANETEPGIYRVTFFFKKNDIKYRISLWPWENQTDVCYDGPEKGIIKGRSVGASTMAAAAINNSVREPILTFPQLFWIFPQTLKYWQERFLKLMTIS